MLVTVYKLPAEHNKERDAVNSHVFCWLMHCNVTRLLSFVGSIVVSVIAASETQV